MYQRGKTEKLKRPDGKKHESEVTRDDYKLTYYSMEVREAMQDRRMAIGLWDGIRIC